MKGNAPTKKSSFNSKRQVAILCLLGIIWIGFQLAIEKQAGDSSPKDPDSEAAFLLPYMMRYTNLDSTQSVAQKFLETSHRNDAGQLFTEHVAFCAYMGMDFEQAESLYLSLASCTRNELSRLAADVGMMRICQRTADYKRFYDFHGQAVRRIRRIEKDTARMTSEEYFRFKTAHTEFCLAEATFHYYQEQPAEASACISRIDHNYLQQNNNPLEIYRQYMQAMLCSVPSGTDRKQATLQEFDMLMTCLEQAEKVGVIYFQANSMQAIAEMLSEQTQAAIIDTYRRTEVEELSARTAVNLNGKETAVGLAEKAIELFRLYGDPFQVIGSYRTLASALMAQEAYDVAADTLEKALALFYAHQNLLYPSLQTESATEDSIPPEIRWTKDDRIKSIPEGILRLRERLSACYAGMGMKMESDYNRNICLDLLTYTGEDQELKSRYESLSEEQAELDRIILGLTIGIIIGLLLTLQAGRLWKKRYQGVIRRLRQTGWACRHSLDEKFSNSQDLLESWEEVSTSELATDFQNLFEATRFRIEACDKPENIQTQINKQVHSPADHPIPEKYESTILLELPEADSPVHILRIRTKRKINYEERALLKVIGSHLAWTLANGKHLDELNDILRQTAEEHQVNKHEISRRKRENITKRAYLSIISAITPLIYRLTHEAHALKKSLTTSTPKEETEEKYHYLTLLTAKIEEYNELLTEWITLKRGDLGLKIETFPIAELFSILEKGKHSFEQNKQQLTIHQTQTHVKADKALTMFMLGTLTENARKYTPEGGHITVEAKEEKDYVELAVSDNGPGISEQDIHKILDEKCYDPSTIGTQSPQADWIKKQKGSGFGLMNCKGIIEKYRKTGNHFSVCSFGIESTLGKGSRFWFRLPKSLPKTLILMLLCFIVPNDSYAESNDVETEINRLLEKAAAHANEAYYANIAGAYEKAICEVDSAIGLLNTHYLMCFPEDTLQLLRLTGTGTPVESDWLRRKFDTDYHIILDLRNEAAVAFLACCRWQEYNYNNLAYTRLYKHICEDPNLEEYCNRLARSASNKKIGIIWCLIMLLGGGAAYYFFYLRRLINHRFHLRLILETERRICSISMLHKQEKKEPDETLGELLKVIGQGLNDIFPISFLAFSIYDEENKPHKLIRYPEAEEDTPVESASDQSGQVARSALDEELHMPLTLTSNGQTRSIGTLIVCKNKGKWNENERLLVTLLSEFTALILQQSVLNPANRQELIDELSEENSRALHEKNRLYVQNQVLDNCLSNIKHETLYYPGRIRQLLKAIQTQVDEKRENGINDLTELTTYYQEVFTLLSSCAFSQLTDITFKRNTFSTELLADHASRHFNRIMQSRTRQNLSTNEESQLEVHIEKLQIIGDHEALCFLIENLMTEMLDTSRPEKGKLTITRQANFALFGFTFSNKDYTPKELNQLFTPEFLLKNQQQADKLHGLGYMVCTTIIREHDTFMGHPGCRIYARQAEQGKGTTVYFTIPLKDRLPV